MKIVPGVQNLPRGTSASLERSAVTIGNFDGLHLGHRALIERVISHARASGGPSVVVTFEPHPVRVLRPDLSFGRIFSLEDQRKTIESLGVDWLIIEPFSRAFSRLGAERFVQDWIYKPFAPSAAVVGYDFAFGEGKSGTIELLQASGARLGFEVEVLAPIKVDGHLISSSRIRERLGEGDVRTAAAMLGRRFYLEGLVEKGAGRGRKLGWPTANLRCEAETFPKIGVYAAWAHVDGERFKAFVNVGRNPTFSLPTYTAMAGAGLPPPSVEAHLSGLAREVYGQKLRLEFVERLRDERKFSSGEELAAQITNDAKAGAEILDRDGRQP